MNKVRPYIFSGSAMLALVLGLLLVQGAIQLLHWHQMNSIYDNRDGFHCLCTSSIGGTTHGLDADWMYAELDFTESTLKPAADMGGLLMHNWSNDPDGVMPVRPGVCRGPPVPV